MPAIRRIYVDVTGTIWSLSYQEFKDLVAEGAENNGKFTLRGRRVKNCPTTKIYDMRVPWSGEQFQTLLNHLDDEDENINQRRH